MPQKVPGSPGAVGHWSPRIFCRITQEQTGEKIKALLDDKLFAMGRRASLWLPVDSATAGVVACTCDKDTTQRADEKCFSCYGSRFAPGYLKFLHSTVFWSSAEVASFTLVNTIIDRTIKPNRIRLSDGQVTGTIVTQDKAFTNPASPTPSDWEVDVVAFRKISTDVITAEFSTNAGTNYYDISLINGVNRPTGTGSIRFRVTMTRASTVTQAPDFEILRVRRPQHELHPALLTQQRPDVLNGEILYLRTWEQERVIRAAAMGVQVELDGDAAWTAPLDLFSTAITPGTPEAKISDRSVGSHPFYEQRDGIHAGQRDAMTEIRYNENLRVFTQQTFSTRRVNDANGASLGGETLSLVF